MVLEKNSSVLEVTSSIAKMAIGFNRRQHKKKRWTCNCGSSMRLDGKSTHLKSAKHKRKLAGVTFSQKKWAKTVCKCPFCGKESTKANLSTHKKSKKCLKRRRANKNKK